MQIRTPDQKLRVFISSTINELADERKIAREVIGRFNMTPVFFEMGARPHPPRELYQAYLNQSEIFVGIYWNSYGWIAPDQQISGLEDEYRLAKDKPKLIYIKGNDAGRDERLLALLREIENEGTISYQRFHSADEFANILFNDIAILLSERFVDSEKIHAEVENNIPAVRNKLLGREKEMSELKAMLGNGESGLITITGPGGTGKTRIALELANELRNNYKDGVNFIDLAAITDIKNVPSSIAHALKLYDSGKQPISEILTEYLRDKNMLLVLDNFEQILEANIFISQLLEHCRKISILITSRAPLQIRYEKNYPLMPLTLPKEQSIDSLQTFPSIKLFIERANQINPGLVINDANLKAISKICERLDGLPLAIELAAARTRILTPVMLAEKIGDSLSLLKNGPRDAPGRQQTLYSTIEWSYNLLTEDAKRVFNRLCCFSDGWTIESAQSVTGNSDDIDIYEITDQLMNFALIKKQDGISHTGEIRFDTLQTVKEFAAKKLQETNEEDFIAKKHLEYFTKILVSSIPHSWVAEPHKWLNIFEDEYQNINQAFNYSLNKNLVADTWLIISALGPLWIYHGRNTEAMTWIEKASITSEAADENIKAGNLSISIAALAMLSTGAMYYYNGNYQYANLYSTKSVELNDKEEKNWGWPRMYQGLSRMSLGDISAMQSLLEGIEIAKKDNDIHCFVVGEIFITEIMVAMGKMDEAIEKINYLYDFALKSGSTLLKALSTFQRANIYFVCEDWKNSAEHYEKSIELFYEMNFVPPIGWGYIGLGSCHTNWVKYYDASISLAKRLERSTRSGDKEMILLALACIAGNMAAQGEHTKSVKLMSAVERLSTGESNYNSWSTNKVARNKVYGIFSQAGIRDQVNANNSFTYEHAFEIASVGKGV